MSILWQNVRRIFWFNFNKPHRKLGLLVQDGCHVQPLPHHCRQPHLSQINGYRSKRFIIATHRYYFSTSPFLTSKTRHLISSPKELRWFHTTPRNNISPLLWIVLKPIGKIWAMLWGRYIRKWWAKIPIERRAHYKELLGGMKGIVVGLLAAVIIAVAVNYCLHLQKNPLTGRVRFISLSPDQLSTMVKFEEQTHMNTYDGKFMTKDNPVWQSVYECAFRILKSNSEDCKEIQKLDWTVSVVDDLETINAFVLPNGHIFVFTGLLNEMKNMDQLAIILGHEISHAVMGHSIEHISRGQVVDFLMIAVLAAIWTFVPGDGIAVVTQWFYNKLMKLMLDLPYSRELESEADEVGLMFAAKACYDVREAPALWKWQEAKIKYAEGPQVALPEFLSTHPANETRTQRLMELVPKALEIRGTCNCSKLDEKMDPRARVESEIETLKANLDKIKSLQAFSK